MTLDALIQSPCPWLQPEGPESEIVLSTRVRLARNVAGRRFVSRLGDDERTELRDALRETVSKALDGCEWYAVDDLPPIDRMCLVERHLVSRELAAGEGPRGVAVDADQQTAVMVCEEDHLRLQAIEAGLQLQATWTRANALDDRLEQRVRYAFSPRLGYLTACPTNVGTGMRASVMLHLPALVLTRQIEKVFRAVTRMRLAVRGLYGEGTQAVGDIYQISNQATLGRAEADILDTLASVIPQVIDYEKQARAALVAESPTALDDRLYRAWGILTCARTISSEETMTLLSAARLGVNLGRLPPADIRMVNDLFLLTRPGHIQKMRGTELTEAERDVARADHIRKRLGLN